MLGLQITSCTTPDNACKLCRNPAASESNVQREQFPLCILTSSPPRSSVLT